ncbi:MAG: DUF885 domain-containing protein [Phycisphaerales bacterium]|nr:DUF885 domain-containing protein [Phycisphaerales bacterium]
MSARLGLCVRGTVLAGLIVGQAAGAQPGRTEDANGRADAALHGAWRAGRAEALLAILDEHYLWTLREEPLTATSRGDRRFNARLRDESPAATARRSAETADRLARLSALGSPRPDGSIGWPDTWTESERTDADLLRFELSLDVRGAAFHSEQMPISKQSGPQVWLPQMGDSIAFDSAQDYADFAARVDAVSTVIEQTMAQMRLGLAAKRLPPRVVMIGTDEQAAVLASETVAASPTLSPFYKPFRSLAAEDPAAARASRAISEKVVPAYAALAEFLRREYIPACRESFGISQGIDGAAAYEHALSWHTTTTLSARQVHDLGLSEVARIRAQMIKVIPRTDWPDRDRYGGDEGFAKFVEYLRADPRFYHKSSDDLLAGYRDIAKRVDAALPRFFGTLPRLSYGVRELPPLAAPTSPTAYYYRGSLEQGLAGFFVANTHRLDQRPRYEMTALTLHEACPGHHLQIALAQEMRDVHPFRTLTSHTAFIEGWALYAERLGLEMAADGSGERIPGPAGPDGPGTGLYADPYDDFGRLTYEMWRACRLVVDTGIHAQGWPRERAVEFMLRNTALSPLNIEREVDRYIAWPGQACAYKIGQLKISELRARAESRLGARFDIRAFHDAVLGAGAIPLPTLEARIERWIEARAK